MVVQETNEALIRKAVVEALASITGRTGDLPAPEALLRRSQLVEAYRKIGIPIATPTLASKATRGGGPPFVIFGRTPLYRWSDALAWAEARMGVPRNSTSEHRVARNCP